MILTYHVKFAVVTLRISKRDEFKARNIKKDSVGS